MRLTYSKCDKYKCFLNTVKDRREGVYDKKEKLYTHMAVQKKSSAGDKPEEKKTNWMQIGVIAFCVLMVVMCVLSFANFQNFFGGNGTAGAAEVGNPVAVQYTMYIGDKAVFTNIDGFIAGYETNESAYISVANSTVPYIIYASEQNAISAGVLGMNIGEKKTVDGSGSALKITYKKEDVEKTYDLDFESLEVGDMLQLTFPYIDDLGEVADAFRSAIIVEKDDAGITVQYGTDKIEMTFAGYLQIS